ncbi:MAG TPA: hypothetical protein VMB03_08585 [Bryobacteraceae bacterium]|nr:hypothetical protein [Bryobacteraceae bacterium]
MAEIVKFAFVLTDNLERKSFKVPQAIVEIHVNGAKDPLTHQKARDAVHDIFLKIQKAVNDDIQQRDLRISRMGVNERKAKKRGEIENGNKKIQELLATFKQEAQARLIAFKKEEAERQLKAEEAEVREDWRMVSFLVNALWTTIKFVADPEQAVIGGSGTIPGAVNTFVKGLIEIKGLVEDYAKVYATCPTMRNKVKEGLASLKSKAKLTKSDVEQFAKDVDLFEDKLLVLELKTKAVASKLNAMIASIPKEGTVKPEAIQEAEKALDKCIKGVVEASTEINRSSKYMVNLKKNLGAAKALAKNDSTFATVLSWAKTAYVKINDLKEFLEDPASWVDVIDKAVKFWTVTGNWMILGELG